MSTFSQFAGGSIKSIQRGTITITGGPGANTATATITAVNPAKTELRNLGFHATYNTDTASPAVRVELTNGTTVTATRLMNDGAIVTMTNVVSWELTEWN